MSGIIDNLPENLTPYERGFIDGMYAYAWMKDGTYYVGMGMHTLDMAIRRFLTDQSYTLKEQT